LPAPAITDWITAVAALISAAAVILIWKQTAHARRQVDELIRQNEHAAQQVKLLEREVGFDHERSRRENAVNMILRWAENMQQESTSARKFVESLDEHLTLKLYREEPLKLELRPDTTRYLNTCLSPGGMAAHIRFDEAGEQIEVSEAAVSFIRWQAIKYLNTLEAVLTTWRHNVADRDIIREQFKYLVNPQKGYNAMAKFREAMGGQNFPAIAAFIKELRTDEPPSEGKPPLNPQLLDGRPTPE